MCVCAPMDYSKDTNNDEHFYCVYIYIYIYIYIFRSFALCRFFPAFQFLTILVWSAVTDRSKYLTNFLYHYYYYYYSHSFFTAQKCYQDILLINYCRRIKLPTKRKQLQLVHLSLSLSLSLSHTHTHTYRATSRLPYLPIRHRSGRRTLEQNCTMGLWCTDVFYGVFRPCDSIFATYWCVWDAFLLIDTVLLSILFYRLICYCDGEKAAKWKKTRVTDAYHPRVWLYTSGNASSWSAGLKAMIMMNGLSSILTRRSKDTLC